MDFTITKIVNDNSDEVVVSINYRVALTAGIARIYVISDDETTCIVEQPWRPYGDGTRGIWTSVEEVVEWFKTESGLGV
jgi:hypothetical protein